MAIVRWRPLGNIFNIQKEMNRLFDEFLTTPPESRGLAEGAWSPSVDISETEHEVVVTAELPGVNQEDVKVRVQDNVLTLSGEKKQEKEIKEKNLHRIERSYGSFHRSFALPVEVDVAKVKATYKSGLLKVTLPKTETSKPKQIDIQVS